MDLQAFLHLAKGLLCSFRGGVCGFLLESRDLVELESALSTGLHHGCQRITHPKQPRDLIPGSPMPQVPCWCFLFQFQAPSGQFLSSARPGPLTLLLAQHPQSQLPASQPIRQLQPPALPGCSSPPRPFSCTPVSIPSGFDGFKFRWTSPLPFHDLRHLQTAVKSEPIASQIGFQSLRPLEQAHC